MTHDTMRIIEDREVLHKAGTEGSRVRRIQRILNTETEEITTIRFWYDTNNNLVKVQ